MTVTLILSSLVVLVLAFLLGPRPRLDPRAPPSRVPAGLSLAELADWLQATEAQVPGLVGGAEARIQFAEPGSPVKTPLSFLYIHGFSATWPETAPLTERLARQFGANTLQARLAGHGMGSEDMVTPAEAWLASMIDAFDIASRLGNKVVIVATSTGAPLSVWLATQPAFANRLHAMLFMSPNFRIRSSFDFLLTWPWSRYWLHWFIGRYREWEPRSEAEAKYWNYRYSTLALIEMQKAVAWARRRDFERITVPLATMYMRNDPTIDPAAAIAVFERWGSDHKALIPVAVDGDQPEHVFVGDITAPHRTDWCVAQFAAFLSDLPAGPEH